MGYRSIPESVSSTGLVGVMQRDRADRLHFYGAWEQKVLGQGRAEKEEVERRRRQAVRDSWDT